MPSYKYTVFDSRTEIRYGRIEAKDYAEAEKLLKDQDWIVVELKSASSAFDLRSLTGGLSIDEELFFYIQFSSLLSAEIPMIKALGIINSQIRNNDFRNVIAVIVSDLRQGLSLSQCMRKHERYFSTFAVGMIESGEESGRLDIILTQLAKISEQRHRFREEIVTALSYPVLLLSGAFVVAVLIIVFVYPQFMEIFKTNDIILPLPTRIISGCSVFLLEHGLMMLFFLSVFVVLFLKYALSPEGKAAIQTLWIRVPLAGNILRNILLYRFFYNMSLLLKNGIPLLKTVELLSRTISHIVITRLLADIWVTLRKGGNMSEAIAKHAEIPENVHQVVLAGEHTGKMDELLDRLAGYYELMADAKLKRINIIIEPVVLFIMGVIVMFLMASLLLPMFRAVQTIR